MGIFTPPVVPQKNMYSIVEYLDDLFKQLNIDIFAIPGDYNFFLLDNLKTRQKYCTNELNMAYAADGYARIRGAGAFVTTGGVGELSAVNGAAGCTSENVFVIHLVGLPPNSRNGFPMHHTLGNGDMNSIAEATASLYGSALIVDDHTTQEQLDAAVLKAYRASKPLYLGIHPEAQSLQLSEPITLTYPALSEDEKQAIIDRVSSAKNPVAVLGSVIRRRGLNKAVSEFLANKNIPYVTMINDKAVIPESHPSFVGMLCGQAVNPEVMNFCLESDLVLNFGGVFSDFNTNYFRGVFAEEQVFNVPLVAESIDVLNAHTRVNTEEIPKLSKTPATPSFGNNCYQKLVESLPEGAELFMDTGSSLLALTFKDMKVNYGHCAFFYSSIGWALPAAVGASFATDKPVVVVIGDGATMMTAQAISTIGRYGRDNFTFCLVNNNSYLIEVFLAEQGDEPYNSIPKWDWQAIPKAFGVSMDQHRVSDESELKSLDINWSYPNFVEFVTATNDCPVALRKFSELARSKVSAEK